MDELRDSVLNYISKRIDFCFELANKLDSLNQQASAENRVTPRNRSAARGLLKTIEKVQCDIHTALAFSECLI